MSSTTPHCKPTARARSDSSLLWDSLDQDINFDDLQEEDWDSLDGAGTNLAGDKGAITLTPVTTMPQLSATPPATQPDILPDQPEAGSQMASGSSSLVSMFDKSGRHIDVDTIDDATWARIMPVSLATGAQTETKDNSGGYESAADEVATIANSSQSFPDDFGDLSPETLAELNRLETQQRTSLIDRNWQGRLKKSL